MRIYKDQLLYSPSDLVSFLGCSYRTLLDRKNIDEPMQKSEVDDAAMLARDKGVEHEQCHLESLTTAGKRVADLTGVDDVETAAEQTLAAMRDGADVVYQAVFHRPPWHGLADFLEWTDGETGLGAHGYEVMDTKLSRTVTPKHVVQIALYSDLLTDLQGRAPQRMHLVLGDGRRESLRPKDFSRYVVRAAQRFEAFVANPPGDLYPEPCEACALCHWKDRCAETWEADDHLSLVANIRRSQRDKLAAAGVTTVRALAELADDAKIPRLASETLERLRAQARLQVARRSTGKDEHELLPLVEGRGFLRMPEPDDGDLFFDMEGDPYFPDGLEYLFGFHYLEGGEPRFTPFWAHDHDQERQAFEQVMDFVVARLSAHPRAHVYHYNHYEETALKRLASQYGTREEELDDLLRGGRLVDLYKVVREGIMVSEPRYSLKNLETFYMDKRGGDVKTAAESIVVYERWCETGEQALLDEIAAYNELDCESTRLLHEWLVSIRSQGVPWLETGDETPADRIEARRDKVEEIEQRVRMLLRGADEDPQRLLVAHLLGFHRREEKPVWWAMFDRHGREDEDLIEDAECLGGLVRDPGVAPFKDKRSMVYTYKAPPQETKLKEGGSVKHSDTLDTVGTVFAIERSREAVRAQLKVGPTKPDPSASLSLIPDPQLRNEPLKQAVVRYADSLISDEGSYRAVSALLRRELPRIGGLEPGTPVIQDGDDVIDATIRAVSGLNRSYLLVQGPPGTGKTYLSSKVIVSLLKEGKRVGVSSNSHKAIENLLIAIGREAEQAGVRLDGVKVGGDSDTALGPGFRREKNYSFIERSGIPQLLGGTAWLFARPVLDQQLDVLFVDEAGQVSLANIVAMGLAAKSIVLVGDQMQLAQPIQGSHPGESGLSALEYLLQGQATIPAERGVFLATTWRMGPELCQFVSDAVYDGHLQPQEKNQSQRLVLDGGRHPAVREAGISFVPIEHGGCSQSSDEEAGAILAIYDHLLRQRYQDRDGRVHPITSDNVLVVSPYNAQVNLLASVLPDGARVGTVDKFQGQEAEVVIVSMATSSAEDLPRNIEFLYSKNRLNVAVSRARTLAIVVASPRLLEIPCSTVRQMELVNTLCWLAEGAG